MKSAWSKNSAFSAVALAAGLPVCGGAVAQVAPVAPSEPAVSGPSGAATGVGSQFELIFWQSVAGSDDRAQLDSYLRRYPNGTFSDLARAKIEALTRRESLAAGVAPRPVATIATPAEAAAAPSAIQSPAPLPAAAATAPVATTSPSPVATPPATQVRQPISRRQAAIGIPDPVQPFSPPPAPSVPPAKAPAASKSPAAQVVAAPPLSPTVPAPVPGAPVQAAIAPAPAPAATNPVPSAVSFPQAPAAVAPPPASSSDPSTLTSLLSQLSKSQGQAAQDPLAATESSKLIPKRPDLQSVPGVDVPARFCSAVERNDYYDSVYKPAKDVADQNNATAIAYLDALKVIYNDFGTRDDVPNMNKVAKEAQDYQTVAADAYRVSVDYEGLFGRLMAVPVQTCQ